MSNEMFDPDALMVSNTPAENSTDELLQGKVQDVTVHQSEASTLEALYDEHQKLIFLFDISGSMLAPLALGAVPEMSEIRWTVSDSDFHRAIIDALRGNIGLEDRAALGTTLQLTSDDEDRDFMGELLYRVTDAEEAKINSLDVTLLKMMLLSTRNWPAFGDYRNPVRRIEMVRQLAKEQVERRLVKYPNADIEILAFDSATHRMRGKTVLEKLESFQLTCLGGMTAIGRAIKDALALCKKAPSSIGLHHLVLVSDAGHNEGHLNEDATLKQMLDLGVVFDMILVSEEMRRSSLCDTFKMWAAQTGGAFEVVATSTDFRQKFLQATERKLLPPASV